MTSSLSPYRCLQFQLSQELSLENVEQIRFLCKLPEGYDTALKIFGKLNELLQLEPANLKELLEAIERKDLAKKVKDYAKSQKKKKNSTSKKDDLQISDLENIDIALKHNRLLHDHVEDIWAKNKLQGEQQEAISEVMKKLHETLEMLESVKESIEGQQQLSDSSSESDTTISPPGTMTRKHSEAIHRQLTATVSSRKMSKQPLFPPTNKVPQLSQEESNTSSPSESSRTLQPLADRQTALPTTSEPNNSSANGGSILVTGNISKLCGATKQKPKPLPKPPKNIQMTQSKMVESKESKIEIRTEKNDRDESGYAGTGDEEFNDPTPFLKIEDTPPPPLPRKANAIYETSPGYYKSIRREKVDEASYYIVTTRQQGNYHNAHLPKIE